MRCSTVHVGVKCSNLFISCPHDCHFHALVTTSISALTFSHIALFTSVSSPLVLTLVLLFTLAARLGSFSVVERFQVTRERLGAMQPYVTSGLRGILGLHCSMLTEQHEKSVSRLNGPCFDAIRER